MKTKATRRRVKTKTVRYDIAEQLRSPEEMAAYLDAWFEEAPDDAAGIARALGDVARARGMTQVARDAGLTRDSLYKALSARGNPSLGVRVRGISPPVTRRLRIAEQAALAQLHAVRAGCTN